MTTPSTPPADGRSARRKQIERRSVGPLMLMRRVPVPVLVIVMSALMLAGLLLPGLLGAVILIVLAAFLSWLLILGAPAMPKAARIGRGAIIVLLVVIAVAKLTQ